MNDSQRLLEQDNPPKELVAWFQKQLNAFAKKEPSGVAAQPTVQTLQGDELLNQKFHPLRDWCLRHAPQLGKHAAPLLPVLKAILATPSRDVFSVGVGDINAFSEPQPDYMQKFRVWKSHELAVKTLKAIGTEESKAALPADPM